MLDVKQIIKIELMKINWLISLINGPGLWEEECNNKKLFQICLQDIVYSAILLINPNTLSNNCYGIEKVIDFDVGDWYNIRVVN